MRAQFMTNTHNTYIITHNTHQHTTYMHANIYYIYSYTHIAGYLLIESLALI